LGEDTYGYGLSLNILGLETDIVSWSGYGAYDWPLAAGNLLPQSAGIEILACNNGRELILYSFDSSEQLTPIWNISPDTIPNNCVYLPDHPGYYCAFVGDRFVQFNGEDGTEFQSTNLVPTGGKKWDYPFDDDHPYLVTLDSNTVSIYKPVVITDADGGEDVPIPVVLSLGKPFPNPFNATQTIPITTKQGRPLTVDVYNLLGQRVKRIYSGVSYSKQFNLSWNANNVPSGIYLIKAVSDNETAIVESILLK
jgi:hypothetical protein